MAFEGAFLPLPSLSLAFWYHNQQLYARNSVASPLKSQPPSPCAFLRFLA
jgi:hypothetical protein